MKKIFVVLLACVMLLSTAAVAFAADEEKGFTYLNFKPEIAEVYDEISAAYEAETGIKVTVQTAASGTYEQTLKSEIAKSDPPVLFQINGPVGYASWKEYCKDLSGTEIYAHLSDKSLAVTSGEGVYGIPYVVEGYGIIYNNAIMEKYFATEGAVVASMDEIKSFETLKAVVEDMTAKKEELGIEGVFASTSLQPGEDWRWQTHLANVPVYYEFKNNGLDLSDPAATAEIKFEYAENFKNLFDLYLNNSCTDPKLLGSKQVNDSMSEFALGKVAMVQNGNWAWSQVDGVEGNVVAKEDIKFMPLYIGVEGEENQGLCTGTENFYAVNAQADPEKQQMAEDFVYWLFSSETGKDFVTNKLGFIAPFDTFEEAEKPSDPLAQEVLKWMENGSTSVSWNFTVFPSQTWKDDFGANLLMYAQGNADWADIVDEAVSEWASEKAMAAE